ncbi:hypothetical protein H7J87_18860 [Mycolicibacterium wolinskyi]|uniref:DUF6461 domain-containing protein n=1 Tax=Mycolicibacterium TaxID=1866885 RepID=UPI001055E3E2|nr:MULTISPECIES: DUF6461 domain-containing protein [Mycolicibacterium]MCV7287387.1 hypothetical protein [Mycolicibacterium wolinskyi]MCV7294974.1 hypothetical protein [Mycolicibacterium goodii]
MSATVDDYSWWSSWRPAWAEAHCVTLVSDITPDHLVGALAADRLTEVPGIDALYAHVVEGWPDDYDPSRAMVGIAGIDGGWSLIAEINGYAGVTESVIEPVSGNRTVVSHFRNVNAVHRFHWWRDGRLLVDFDLLFPTERFGAEPDALLDDIRGVGIPLDADPAHIADVDLSAAGFALAQRITGVACTPTLFENSRFVVATVAITE